MQATTPLASAFPVAMQTVSLFNTQHPEIAQWLNTMKTLLTYLPNMNTIARGQAYIVCKQAAKVLAYVQESASTPQQVDVLQYLWGAKHATQRAAQTFGIAAQSTGAPSGPNSLTVSLSVAASNAVTSLLSWDASSPLAPAPPGNPPGLLLSIANGTSVVIQLSAAQNGPTQQYIVYQVMDGDTLLSITNKFLGSPAQSQILATFNNLRYPYISANLAERTGISIATWLLQSVQVQQASGMLTAAPITSVGALSAVLVGANPQAGEYLVFESPQSQEAREITSISGSTLSWGAPLAYAYQAGSTVTLCQSPSASGAVLGPGDPLLIPTALIIQSSVVGSTANDPGKLGTDIANNTDGSFPPLNGTGDLQTASGLLNLQQALRIRLQTALGALPLHPRYGANQEDLHTSGAFGMHLAEAEVQSTILQDPRVQGVKNLQVSIKGDVLYFEAIVALAGYQSPVSLSDQIALSAQ